MGSHLNYSTVRDARHLSLACTQAHIKHMSTCSITLRPSHNTVCGCVAAWDASLTRIGSDTHQTRCVPQPAPVARGLSIPAPSVALAQWQCLWHMSQSFKCLLFSAGWLGARCSQGKDDILCRAEGGGGTCCGSPLPASSGCQPKFPLSISKHRQINLVILKRRH